MEHRVRADMVDVEFLLEILIWVARGASLRDTWREDVSEPTRRLKPYAPGEQLPADRRITRFGPPVPCMACDATGEAPCISVGCTIDCPHCHGRGWMQCMRCEGTGTARKRVA